MNKRITPLIMILALLSISMMAQKFENLALTPPMGWNSWNNFGCEINEDLIRQVTDAMDESGMKDAGYEYIVIDDCWHGQRDSLGFIQCDLQRFPSGIKALIDYVHSKGLKFGIYSDAGNTTCAGRPGSRGHEYQDALTYASWGVDYLKYDWCDTEGLSGIGAYTTMSQALKNAGHPILFSLCDWGHNKPWEWAKEVGHMWRTTGDIYNCWDCAFDHGDWFSWGVLKILDMNQAYNIREYAGPGNWNDPDMLEVGNGMSVNEDRGHFAIWTMLAAPLIAGNDIRNMSKETFEILTNDEAIAINQDKLGIQAFRYAKEGNLETWIKPLSNGNWAFCFLNRGDNPVKLDFKFKGRKIEDTFAQLNIDFDATTYNIRNVWTKMNLGTTKKAISTTIPGRDVLQIVLKHSSKN